MFVIKGIAASPGVTIGPAVLLPTADFAVANQYVDAAEVKAEIAKFNRALEKNPFRPGRKRKETAPNAGRGIRQPDVHA